MEEVKTDNDVIITSAELVDLAEIADIENRSNPIPWTIQQLTDSVNNHDVLVLKHRRVKGNKNNSIYAFLISQIIVDEGSILHIAVDSTKQSKGLGRKLLETWIKSLPKTVITVWLEVRESNIKAQNLYTSCGFSKTGERKDYYRQHVSNPDKVRETAYIYSLQP